MRGKMYQMLMMMAMMGAMNPDMGQHYEKLTPEDIAEIKRVYEQKKIERMKKRGMKEFSIDGFKVLALNEKNAIRKINKLKADKSHV